ncbi:MAG: hypothetical protein JJT96_16000 [Opitutales bacterium]|nr:hypothetical protein [Opitutales bacterium]
MNAISELEFKQRLAGLSASERRSISAYLLKLKHAGEDARAERDRLMAEMDAGNKTRLTDLEKTTLASG